MCGGLDRLTVDDPGTRLAVRAGRDPDITAQESMPHLPGAIVAPLTNGVLDNPPGRQVMRSPAPRAAAAQTIQDGRQDLPRRVHVRAAAWCGFGHPMLNPRPCVLTESGRVGWSWVHTPDETRSSPTLVNFLDTL